MNIQPATAAATTSMTAVTWNVRDLPVRGWLHSPQDGISRGIVVLCPPVGKEHTTGYLPLHILAQRLAEHGIAALRFDYVGVGDSAGDLDTDDLVELWLESVASACQFARECGAENVSAVGLRLGATLLAQTSARCGPLDGIVLWDPYATGKAFLRAQSALYMVSNPNQDVDDSRDGGGIRGPGFLWPPTVVSKLNTVGVSADIAEQSNVLLLTVPNRKPRGGVKELAEIAAVTTLPATEQSELFDVEDMLAVVPSATIDTIVSWCEQTLPETKSHVRPPSDACDVDVVVGQCANGDIVERMVFLGDDKLPAITTSVRGSGEQPLVIFFNTAAGYRIGPYRLWVGIARDLAARGLTCVRIDNPDVGDGPIAVEQGGVVMYSSTPLPDLQSAINDAIGNSAERKVGVVGLCSGSWIALQLGMENTFTSAYLINPLVWDTKARQIGPNAAHRASFIRLVMEVFDMVSWLRPVASGFWRTITAMGFIRGPIPVLKRFKSEGTRVVMYLGSLEQLWFDRGITRAGRKWLQQNPDVSIEREDSNDHALVTGPDRERVTQLLLTHIPADLESRTEHN